MAAATLNDALTIIGKLKADDREELYEVLCRRHIEAWRKEVAACARKAVADSKAGRLKSYTAEELIRHLNKQWEEPDA